MPSTRPNLTLDEQSFQGLLAAAFTIQQHNDRRSADLQNNDRQNNDQQSTQAQSNDHQNNARQNNDRQNNDRQNNDLSSGVGASSTAREAEARPKPHPAELCRKCGAPIPTGRTSCTSCGNENFRPGERLQRTWASLWLMSQEQNLGTQFRENAGSDALPLPSPRRPNGHNSADSPLVTSSKIARSVPAEAEIIREAIEDQPENLAIQRSSFKDALLQAQELEPSFAQIAWQGYTPDNSETADLSSGLTGGHDPAGEDATLEETSLEEPGLEDAGHHDLTIVPGATASHSLNRGLGDLRVKLRFHRADLYLGLAVLVALVALLWPAASAERSKLQPWERMLIAMGIAEAPTPVVHYRGDPNIKVWVDTQTALYYCPGEELYGKSPGGHFSTQHEAQLDHFEPAERSACVE